MAVIRNKKPRHWPRSKIKKYIKIKAIVSIFQLRITCIMLILEKFINAKYGEIKNIFIYVSMQSYIKKTSGSDSSFYMPPIYDYYFLAGIS